MHLVIDFDQNWLDKALKHDFGILVFEGVSFEVDLWPTIVTLHNLAGSLLFFNLMATGLDALNLFRAIFAITHDIGIISYNST